MSGAGAPPSHDPVSDAAALVRMIETCRCAVCGFFRLYLCHFHGVSLALPYMIFRFQIT
jgi:hypothetical protein